MSDNKRMITHYVGDRCPGGHRNDPMEQREAQVTKVKYDKEQNEAQASYIESAIGDLQQNALTDGVRIVVNQIAGELLDLIEAQHAENERLKERVKLLESALGAIHEQRYFRGG